MNCPTQFSAADPSPATRLAPAMVAKPWGRCSLAPWSDLASNVPIGEMIYRPPGGDDAELLVKALFTGERLSVQVHPDDATARAAGHRRGKDEAWLILDAAPGATIGLGLKRPVAAAALASAARDGSIEALLDWRPCRAGDVFFAPAGTIHAIGADISLIEVQQNLDVTYRLFDYGRPRELHLDEAVTVADAAPWQCSADPRPLGDGRTVLVEGPSFVVERVRWAGVARVEPLAARPVTMVVLSGRGRIAGQRCGGGEVWTVETGCEAGFDTPADLLLAYPGAEVAAGLWQGLRQGLAA